MLVHIAQKRQFYGIQFIFNRRPYNNFHLLDMLSVARCDEIL